MKALLLFCLSLPVLAACKQDNLQDMAPALLRDVTPAARQELAARVSEALGGRDVLLADDVFTGRSDLVVEPYPRRDPMGNRLPGRIMSEPERFRLGLSRERCILLHTNSGRHWMLTHSHCVAATGSGAAP